MIRKILLFHCYFFITFSAFSQFVVTGIVRDKISRQPIDSVRIAFENAQTFSDTGGFFELAHDGTQRILLVTVADYKTERLILKKNASAALFLEMQNIAPSKNYFKRSVETGFFNLGKIEIGHIGDIYRSNRVEGARLTLPLQTGDKFSKNVKLGACLGYGFGDEKWKYGASAQFLLPTESNQFISVDYQDDIFKIGSNRQVNLLRGARFTQNQSSLAGELFPIHRDFKLNRKRELNVAYERSWNKNFASLINLRVARNDEGMFVPFGIHYFDNEAVMLHAQWHFGERRFDGLSTRFWQENLYPIVQLSAEAGNFTMGNKNRQYAHFRATLQQGIQSSFGKLTYALETGYIAGRVPFPLLQIPRGNETCIISDYSFTMMNYMEFAADTYAALYAGYQFDNLLLGRIAITNMLGMKEMISVKTMVGSLRNSHNEIMPLPGFTEKLNSYAELSAGIAGILGLLNVESVWRLTDRQKPDIRNWGLRVKLLIDL